MTTERPDPFLRALTGTHDEPVLTLERRFATTPMDLWHALTDSTRLARWFGDVDPRPQSVGDGFVARLSPDDDVAACRLEACDPPVRLRIAWQWADEPRTEVEVTLTEDGGGTVLRLTHERLHGEHLLDYGGGWEALLSSLHRLLDRPTTSSPASAGGQAWRDLRDHPLELEQVLLAPPEQVWTAFTDRDRLAAWWWNHWDDVQIELEARPGGRYAITAPTAGLAISGTFLEVRHLEHLSFTWAWTDAEGTSVDEACDLRFEPVAEGTRLRLRHTGPWRDADAATSYRQGWEFTLGALTRLLRE